MKKECVCNDDRGSGIFKNGHFQNCPLCPHDATPKMTDEDLIYIKQDTEMKECIKRYNQAKEDGTLDRDFPKII